MEKTLDMAIQQNNTGREEYLCSSSLFIVSRRPTAFSFSCVPACRIDPKRPVRFSPCFHRGLGRISFYAILHLAYSLRLLHLTQNVTCSRRVGTTVQYLNTVCHPAHVGNDGGKTVGFRASHVHPPRFILGCLPPPRFALGGTQTESCAQRGGG